MSDGTWFYQKQQFGEGRSPHRVYRDDAHRQIIVSDFVLVGGVCLLGETPWYLRARRTAARLAKRLGYDLRFALADKVVDGRL